MEELVNHDELKEEFLEKFRILVKKHQTNPNEEDDHIEADNLLCILLGRLGFDEIVSLYDEIDKWYA